MNKIFKVIWSKAKGCYIVVSEIAKNQTKSGRRQARDLALAAIVGIGVTMSAGMGMVYAEESGGDQITDPEPTVVDKAYVDQEVGKVQTQVTANKAEIDKKASQKDLETVDEKAAENAGKIAEVEDKVATNETAIASVKTTAEAAQDKANANETKIDEVETKVNTNTGAIASVKDQAEAAQTTANAAKTQAETNAENITTNTNAIAGVKTTAQAAQKKADDNATEIAEVKTTADENKAALETLTGENGTISNLTGRVSANETAITNLQNDKANKTDVEQNTGDIAKLNGDAEEEGSVANSIKTAIDAEKAEGGAIKAAQDKADANETKINTLNGDADAEGSVANKIATAINEVNQTTSGLDGRLTTVEGKAQTNEDAITKLNGEADEEGSVAKSIKDAIDAQVNGEDGAIKANTDAIAKLNGNDETEGSVAYAVKAEQTRAEAAEKANKDAIDLLNSNENTEGSVAYAVKAEQTRAEAAEKANEAAIAQEVTDRIAAINKEVEDRNTAITNAINTEATRVDGVITGVQTQVTANTAAITQEVTDRTTAISEVNTRLNAITADFKRLNGTGDGSIAAAIKVEADRAKGVELGLDFRLGQVEDRVNDVYLVEDKSANKYITHIRRDLEVDWNAFISGDLMIGTGADRETITFNSVTGTISGLTNTEWTTPANKEEIVGGASQVATQGQLYDIAKKGFKVNLSGGGSINVPLAGEIGIVGDENINITKGSDVATIQIGLTTEPTFNSVTVKNNDVANQLTYTEMNADGFWVYPNPGVSASTVSLTSAGLSNGGNQLKNIAAGTDSNDAVNYQQLLEQRFVIRGGGSVEVEGHKGDITVDNDVIQGTIWTISHTDHDTLPTADGSTTTVNGSIVSVKLSGNSIIADGENGLKINPVLTLGDAANLMTVNGNDGSITGMKNIGWYNRTNTTYEETRAATEGQIADIVNQGWTLEGNNTSETLELNKTASVVGGSNVVTHLTKDETTGNLQLTVNTNSNMNLGTITLQGRDVDGNIIAGSNTLTINNQTITGLTNTHFFNTNPVGSVKVGVDSYQTYGNVVPQAGSTQAATEAQLVEAFHGLNKADRYITKAEVGRNGANIITVTLKQNNAADVVFQFEDIIGKESTTTGGGTSLTPTRDNDNDKNNDNWFIQSDTERFENTTLATMESARVLEDGTQVKSSKTAITGTLNSMADDTTTQVTNKLNFVNTGKVDKDDNLTFGHSYTIMDTAGNAITLRDLASAEVLQTVHGVVSNHDGRINVLEGGFKVKAGTILAIEGNVQAGNTFEFTGNKTSENKNIEIYYNNRDNILDVSVVDEPKFNSIEVGGQTKTTIDSTGIHFNGKHFIGTGGINANAMTITNVHNGRVADGSLDAVNGGQLYPIQQAIIDGFSVNGHKISLYDAGTQGFTIDGSQNINVETSGNVITVKTEDIPKFQAVEIGTTYEGVTTNIIINDANQGTITNLKNKTWTLGSQVAEVGRAATEEQLLIVDQGLTSKGMKFQGDDGTTVIHKNLGDTLQIKGGAQEVTSADNIRVYWADNNGNSYLKVGLAKDVDLTPDGSITVNFAKLDTNGLTVGDRPEGAGGERLCSYYYDHGMTIHRPTANGKLDLMFTDTEISAGDLVIQNVHSGLTKGDNETGVNTANAANIGDVIDLTTDVLGDRKNIDVTTVVDENGKKTSTVGLKEVVDIGSNVTPEKHIRLDGNSVTGTIGGIQINGGDTQKNIIGLGNTVWSSNNYVADKAATEGQLYDIVNGTQGNNPKGGWGLSTDRGIAGEEGQVANRTHRTDIGNTLEIIGGVVAGNKNIYTQVTESGITINLNQTLELGAGDRVVVDGELGFITVGRGNEAGKVTIDGAAGIIKTGRVEFNGLTDTGKVGGILLNGLDTDTYIGGLSNRNWYKENVHNYTQSTKAATEAQLAQYQLKDTDWRLVENPDMTVGDKAYIVDDNGYITLVMQNANNPENTQQIFIENVAKKSELDNVQKDYVKKVTEGQGTNAASFTVTQMVDGKEETVTIVEKDTHIKRQTYTVNADGIVELIEVDAAGNQMEDKVVIEGIATKDEVATLRDSAITFVGNDENGIAKKLGETLTIKGTAQDVTATTNFSNNIYVENVNGDLVVKMLDDISLDSVAANRVDVGGAHIENGKLTVDKGEGANKVTTTIEGDKVNTNRVETNQVALGGNSGIVLEHAGVTAQPANMLGASIDRIKYGDRYVATMDDGLVFTTDDGNEVTKKLNDTLSVKGDDNIATKFDNNGIKVELNKDVDLTAAGSLAIGTTNIASGNATIGNVNVDGVNNKVVVGAEADTNKVTIDGKDGQVKVGKNTIIENGSATFGDKDSLNKVTIDGANGIITSGKVTINKENLGTVNGLTNKEWKQGQYISGQAATEDQLQSAIGSVTIAGLDFAGDSGTDVIHKDLGAQLNIKGGATGTLTDNNIGVVVKDGALNVKLAEDIVLGENGSLNIGDTTIDNTGVQVGDNTTIGDGNATIGGVEIDGSDVTIGIGDNKIEIYGDDGIIKTGDIEINSDENTITVGDTTIGDGSASFGDEDDKKVVIDGTTGEVTVGDKTDIGNGSANIGNVTINGTDTTGTVNGLTNIKWDSNNIVSGQAATEDQVKAAIDGAIQGITGSGLNFAGDSGEEVHTDMGDTLNIQGGAAGNLTTGNIGVVADKENNKLNVQLAENINLGENGSLTAGDTTVDKDGLHVGDTTIGNGSATIGGVEIDGNGVTIGSGDNKVEINGEDGTISTGDITIDGANKQIQVGDTTIGDGSANIGDVTIDGNNSQVTVGSGDNQVTIDGAAGTIETGDVVINGTDNTIQVGDTTIGDGSATIGGVEINGEDNEITLGDTTIGDGSASIGGVEIDGEKNKVTVGDKTTISDGSASFDKVNINGTDGTVSGLTNTTWDKNKDYTGSSNAATEGQVMEAVDGIVENVTQLGMNFAGDAGEAHKDLGTTLTIQGGADVSNLSDNNIGVVVDNGAVNIKLNNDISINSVTAADKVTVGDKVELNSDGSATIGNVNISAAGDISNGKHNLNADGSASLAGGKFEIAANGNINSSYDGGSITADGHGIEASHGDSTVKVDNQGTTFTNGSANGSTNINGSTVTAGKVTIDGSKQIVDAGNVKLDGAAGNVTIQGVDGTKADISVSKGQDVNGTEDKRLTIDGTKVATQNDGFIFKADNGADVTKKLNEAVKIEGSNNITTSTTADGNIQVSLNNKLEGLEEIKLGDNTVINGDSLTTSNVNADKVTVKEEIAVGESTVIKGDTISSNKLEAKEEVKVGDTTINKDGLTIQKGEKESLTITKDKVDVAGSKIENVGAGAIAEDSKDAVNGSQLWATNQQVAQNAQNINRVGNRVNRVGARAAALAALHPMDFDPDDKLSFAGGYGSYHGENAGAIAAFYRPDEKTMFSISGTVSNQENMFNAGVSFSLDRAAHNTNSKTAMAKQILDLTAKVNMLTNANEKMMNALRDASQNGGRVSIEFPDIPQGHWAYGYVMELAQLGYLEGYPDGQFKGDRVLTRYEFATALYRALMNGAPVDDKMGRGMDEFSKELDNVAKAARFRVDRVAGMDNDRNKVERVRTNDKGDASVSDYRDVYGSKIAAPAQK